MAWLPVGIITIDKYRVSMVNRQSPQITLSVALDDRKRLVFRPFEQISARFGGTVSLCRTLTAALSCRANGNFSTIFLSGDTSCPPLL